MRYVQKIDTPQFFINDTSNLEEWGDYYANKKRKLKEYILEKEQHYLCIYCESKVNVHSSHLEHIKPRNTKSLIFNYNNIVVSCNGDCHNIDDNNTKHHCGHKKDASFDENKFLNPVKVLNIREYFKYNNNYEITPSDNDTIKSKYMIDTLHLNDSQLPQARKKALINFRKKINNLPTQTKKETMRQVFKNENIAFISCLIFKYKENIETK